MTELFCPGVALLVIIVTAIYFALGISQPQPDYKFLAWLLALGLLCVGFEVGYGVRSANSQSNVSATPNLYIVITPTPQPSFATPSIKER